MPDQSSPEDNEQLESLLVQLKHQNYMVAFEAAQALRKLGEPTVLPLIEALQDWRSRSRAAVILGNLGDIRAVEPLINVLHLDTDAEARYLAALALGNLGDARAVGPLINSLQSDGDSTVRHSAVSALGDLGDARAVEPLINALSDPDWELRQQAALSLGKLGDGRAIGVLIEALQDTYNEVREWVIEALGMLRAEQALPALQWITLHDDAQTFEGHSIKATATEAIRQIKGHTDH